MDMDARQRADAAFAKKPGACGGGGRTLGLTISVFVRYRFQKSTGYQRMVRS